MDIQHREKPDQWQKYDSWHVLERNWWNTVPSLAHLLQYKSTKNSVLRSRIKTPHWNQGMIVCKQSPGLIRNTEELNAEHQQWCDVVPAEIRPLANLPHSRLLSYSSCKHKFDRNWHTHIDKV